MSTISASAANYHDGGVRFLSNDQNNKAQNNDAISHNPLEEPKTFRKGSPEAREHLRKIKSLFYQLKKNSLEEPKDLRKGSPEAREHLRKIKSLFYQFQEKSKEITRAVDLELSDKHLSEVTSTVLRQVHSTPEIRQLKQQKLELKDALVLELKKAGVDIKSPKQLSLAELKEKIDLAAQNLSPTRHNNTDTTRKDFSKARPISNSKINQLTPEKLKLKNELVWALKQAGVDIKSSDRLSLAELKEKIDLAVENLRAEPPKRTSDNTDDGVSEERENRPSHAHEVLRAVAALSSRRNTRSSSAFI